DAFRSDLRGVLASRRDLAVVAGPERLRLVVADEGDLAAQHHDARIEVVGVQLLGEAGLLAAMHDLETLAAQIALERLAAERSCATAARQQGDAFRPDLLGMHAARRHLEALPGSEGDRGVVAGDGDLAAQDERL